MHRLPSYIHSFLYFVHVFCAPKTTPKQSQNDLRCHRHFFRVTVIFFAPPPPLRAATVTPCSRRRSFLITIAAFGSSWVNKGDDGLGLEVGLFYSHLPHYYCTTNPKRNNKNYSYPPHYHCTTNLKKIIKK